MAQGDYITVERPDRALLPRVGHRAGANRHIEAELR